MDANSPAGKTTNPTTTTLNSTTPPADAAHRNKNEAKALGYLVMRLWIPGAVIALLGGIWVIVKRGKQLKENKKAWGVMHLTEKIQLNQPLSLQTEMLHPYKDKAQVVTGDANITMQDVNIGGDLKIEGYRPRLIYFREFSQLRSPDEKRLNFASYFIPSEEDYSSGRVYRPAIVNQIQERLEHERLVLVRGVGASGKTVLSWIIAHEALNSDCTVYELDLSSFPDADLEFTHMATDEFVGHASHNALFIIDNCHFDESFTKDIAIAHMKIADGLKPRLLLIGREIQSSYGSLIDGLNLIPFTLKALQPEALGVYLRLAWQATGDCPPPIPSDKVLADWVMTFGGDPDSSETTTDLIALSAAIRNRLSYLLKENWTLSANDARTEIRSIYLSRLSDGEMHNLLCLCAMEELELGIEESALLDQRCAFIESSQRLGLVFRRMVYLGDESHIQYELAHAALSRLILQAAYQPVDTLELRKQIARNSFRTSVNLLARLARFSNNEHRRSEGYDLIDTILSTNVLYNDIESVSSIQRFFYYSAEFKVAIPEGLIKNLSSQEYMEVIASRVSQMSIGKIINYISFFKADPSLYPIAESLMSSLSRPKNHDSLLRSVLNAPLESISRFLDFTGDERNLVRVYNIVDTEIWKPANFANLVQLFETAPLDKISGCLGAVHGNDIWESVLLSVDMVRWEALRMRDIDIKIDAYQGFQKHCLDRGRNDLLKHPTIRLIETSTDDDWNQPGIGLKHLSTVIRNSRSVDNIKISEFLTRIATPTRIDELFKNTPTGALGGYLLTIAVALDPDDHTFFCRDSLSERLISEFVTGPRQRETKDWADLISLLGAAQAVAINPDLSKARWPTEDDVNKIVYYRAPVPNQKLINHSQVRIWLGLKAMSSWRSDYIHLPRDIGNEILNLVMNTQLKDSELHPISKHIRESNQKLITWLRRCKNAGWVLWPDTHAKVSTEKRNLFPDLRS
jgi:hypothetical protein